MRRKINGMALYMALVWLVIIGVFVALVLTACTTTRYLPVESVRTERHDVEHWRVDTVRERDVRFILARGDTVIDRQILWRERVKEVHDTVLTERCDTISLPYPIEVPARLSLGQKIKLNSFWPLAGIAVLLAVILFLKKKFRFFH